MAGLSEILKDKKNWPDDTKFALGNGIDMTIGELRAYQDATGADVAKALEAERAKVLEEQQRIQDEQVKLAAGQEEVVKLWQTLQEAQAKIPKAAAVPAGLDWREDPFFAPVAKYMKDTVEAAQAKQAQDIENFRKALGLGVKYISDVISEQRYAMLPEDFRKAIDYNAALKTAAERRYLDTGGVPDVRRVYDEWESPRRREAELKKVREETYEKARNELMSSALARPSGVPMGVEPPADPNAPKTLRDSFNRLKQDPEFNKMIYGLTGEGQA